MTTNRQTGLLAAALLCSLTLAVLAISAVPADAAQGLIAALGRHGFTAYDLIAANVAVVGLAASSAKLSERRAALHTEMNALITLAETEDRDLTEEEKATFAAKKVEDDGLAARLDRARALEASTAALDAVVPAAGRGNGIIIPPGPHAKKEFESLGEFLSAVRFNQNDPRLQFEENQAAIDPETGQLRSEFRMDNGPSGGFMVPAQLLPGIRQVEPQEALVRPRAEVIPAGDPPDASITVGALDQTGSNPGNMFGGMTMAWIGEGETKPETDAKLRTITLTPHEIAGTAVITDKMLRNWVASRTYIENLMRGAVNAAEDYAYLRGTGVNQPLGVINAGATKWHNRAVANQISYVDLVNLVSRLLIRGNANSPIWSIPQSAMVQIATLTDPEGHYIWVPNAREGFAGTLLGYPVRWNNRAPALGSKGDVILADWGYYLIKDGSGPYVAMSEHVYFTTNKTVFKVFWNVDGSPWLTAPIKEENGYEVSPFVGLDVPA